MRLNAKQIGILAECIEKCLIRYPIREMDDEERATLKGSETIEEWEYRLAEMVNDTTDLPQYIDIDDNIAEMLVHYIDDTIHPPKEMIDGEFEYTEHERDEK